MKLSIVIIALFLITMVVADDYPHLIELSARPWLYELSKKYGKHIRLEDVPDLELHEFKAKGMTAIYLLGVWHLGAYGLNHDRTDPGLLKGYGDVLPGFTTADIIGSPFAVTKYTVNPEIGTSSDLHEFRRRLNDLGIKLILDFVPNHTAIDASTVTSKTDLYVQHPPNVHAPFDRNIYTEGGVFYGKDKWGYIWTDTAQLNYFNPETVAARLSDVMTVAGYADGIRCDMAMLAMNDVFGDIWGSTVAERGFTRPAKEFWEVAIGAAKRRYPNVIFMAEQYWGNGPRLNDLGFDYVYDKEGLYDTVSNLNSGNEGQYIPNIKGYIKQHLADGYLTRGAHFISNHDQDRAAFHWGEVWRADLAGLVSFTVPGLRFHWMGQWEGHKHRLDVHLRRQTPEAASPVAKAFYDALLPAMQHPVFRRKDVQVTIEDVAGDDGWKVLAMRLRTGSDAVLVCINLSGENAGGDVVLPDVKGNGNVQVTELMSGKKYTRDAGTMRGAGLFVEVDSNYAQMFQYPV